MSYEIFIMPEALEVMERGYEWLLPQTMQHAPEWYNGLLDAINSLEEFPARFPLAPESRNSPVPIRQLLYGDKRHGFRILYEIRGQVVRILHIRHAARDF